jgi:hypothetical protein
MFSAFAQLPALFVHVPAWQCTYSSFTVTHVSGNATTSAWPNGGQEQLEQDEAAHLLDVPLDALLRWSRQLEFPADVGAPGAPRFRRREVELLRDALAGAHSVEGAIREARRRLGDA